MRVPTSVVICITITFLSVVFTLGWLTYQGVESAEFTRFLNTVLNLVSPLLSGAAAIYAGKAAQQTNGGLDQRMRQAAREVAAEDRR